MNYWEQWEDYRNGMYRDAASRGHVTASVALLSDPGRFHDVAAAMLTAWPVAAVQNLRHMWSGRNAWIGQASCLFAHGAPSAATREAWGLLTNPVQSAANAVARLVREEWERSSDGAQTLFAD